MQPTGYIAKRLNSEARPNLARELIYALLRRLRLRIAEWLILKTEPDGYTHVSQTSHKLFFFSEHLAYSLRAFFGFKFKNCQLRALGD